MNHVRGFGVPKVMVVYLYTTTEGRGAGRVYRVAGGQEDEGYIHRQGTVSSVVLPGKKTSIRGGRGVEYD